MRQLGLGRMHPDLGAHDLRLAALARTLAHDDHIVDVDHWTFAPLDPQEWSQGLCVLHSDSRAAHLLVADLEIFALGRALPPSLAGVTLLAHSPCPRM